MGTGKGAGSVFGGGGRGAQRVGLARRLARSLITAGRRRVGRGGAGGERPGAVVGEAVGRARQRLFRR